MRGYRLKKRKLLPNRLYALAGYHEIEYTGDQPDPGSSAGEISDWRGQSLATEVENLTPSGQDSPIPFLEMSEVAEYLYRYPIISGEC